MAAYDAAIASFLPKSIDYFYEASKSFFHKFTPELHSTHWKSFSIHIKSGEGCFDIAFRRFDSSFPTTIAEVKDAH